VGAGVLGGGLGPMQVYANKDEEQMVTDIVHRYAHESQVEDDKKDEAEMELIQVFFFLPSLGVSFCRSYEGHHGREWMYHVLSSAFSLTLEL
jgi:hypothetical protein